MSAASAVDPIKFARLLHGREGISIFTSNTLYQYVVRTRTTIGVAVLAEHSSTLTRTLNWGSYTTVNTVGKS